jgi:hypothetical protein
MKVDLEKDREEKIDQRVWLFAVPVSARKVALRHKLSSFIPSRALAISTGLAGLLVLLASGCRREEIRVYTTSKDHPQPSVEEFLSNTNDPSAFHGRMGGGMGAAQAEASESRKPEWTIPTGWQEQPPSAMVLARFSVSDPALGDAEVTVTVFPGDVGGLLANVNRWRRQIGLEAIEPADLPKVTSTIEVNGDPATLVDLVNPQGGGSAPGPNRLLVVLVSREGRTWFYKMAGPDELVTTAKPELIKFVQSARYPHAA